MNVNEIFNSIDGEGRRAGMLASFIRLTGCNLRCSYCDTRYSFHEGEEMSVQEIAKHLAHKNVTLTGGEPLLQDCTELLEVLKDYDVNIETNGSKDISKYLRFPHVWFTIDYKCDSSNMSLAMHEENFKLLRRQDVLKFVVGSQLDLEQALRLWQKLRGEYGVRCQVYVSPVYGEIEPSAIVKFMQENNCTDWRVQLQLHKYIWQPNERGV